MKIIIDSKGYLLLERKNKLGYEPQFCPFTPDARNRCGTWCPHFGEIEKPPEGDYLLCICQGSKIYAWGFTDERK